MEKDIQEFVKWLREQSDAKAEEAIQDMLLYGRGSVNFSTMAEASQGGHESVPAIDAGESTPGSQKPWPRVFKAPSDDDSQPGYRFLTPEEMKEKGYTVLVQEHMVATISEYEDRGSYVIVDIGDGEELANSLEEVGIPVTRLSIFDVLKDPEDNA